MSVQFIKVDSSLRYNPTTTYPSDCVIPSNEVLDGVYMLKSIMLPITYHNINSSNNVVYFTDTGGAHTATLTSGHYSSVTTLCTTLAAAMTTAGAGTVTCTEDSLTGLITVTSTVNFTFTFATNTLNSASLILGFIGDSAVAATSQVASRMPQLNSTSSYNFSLSSTAGAFRTLRGESYTFCIPALSSTPSSAYYEPSSHFPITFRINSTTELGIKIFDDQYHILNNMSSNFFIVLQKISS